MDAVVAPYVVHNKTGFVVSAHLDNSFLVRYHLAESRPIIRNLFISLDERMG